MRNKIEVTILQSILITSLSIISIYNVFMNQVIGQCYMRYAILRARVRPYWQNVVDKIFNVHFVFLTVVRILTT